LTTGFGAPDFGDGGTELTGVRVRVLGDSCSGSRIWWLRIEVTRFGDEFIGDDPGNIGPASPDLNLFKGGRPIFGGVRGEYNKEFKEVVEEFDSMESWRVAYGLPNAGDNGGVGEDAEDAEDEAYSYTLLISSSQRRDTRRPVEVLMVQWWSGTVWIGVVIVTDLIERAIIIPEKTISKLLLNKKICLSTLSKKMAGGRYVMWLWQ
jgi:hypothetical protein